MQAIERAKTYSRDKISQLRSKLDGVPAAGEMVVLCGSFAREEASDESDADWFAITSQPKPANKEDFDERSIPWLKEVREGIQSIVKVEPSPDGAFAEFEHRNAMLLNIGGDADSNAKITRRMLFLLEGCALTDAVEFKAFRREILNRYINENISDHQLALFLLNDIIRYYRTMTVDYEFKTGEGTNPKPWGLRNIKLVFSRKLLYASGLFSVAQTANRTPEEKIDRLELLFDLPVLDRMEEICGRSETKNMRLRYNHFLERIEDASSRESLKKIKREDRNGDKLFRELKNDGHHFTRDLLKLYDQTFDSTHPIRRAVIF